ncbi:LPS export ABC transporter periplasmic protein LptC [filamentous cyanobacterium CCP2]|nr:LPS export ABC transporter periplasmic protein LptC [filamentous cyanobacterium CCP2]
MGWMRSIALPVMVVSLLIAGVGCRTGSQGADRLAEDSSAAAEIDSNLVFENITLEQVDEAGQLLWKVDAERATYSPDQRNADIINPEGELYQDGKAVYQIQAQKGEIRRDGNRIFMRGNVIATDIESGAVLRGDEMEWQPYEDLLIVKGNLTGTHPQLRFTAREARASNQERQIELLGAPIEAITEDEPILRLQGERLVWKLDEEMVLSDRPVQVQELEGEQVTNQANGNAAEVNLQAKTIRLMQTAILTLADPPLQLSGESFLWNVDQQTLISEQPITVFQREENIIMTANQGRIEYQPQIAYFTGNVRASGLDDQSLLTSDRLTWNIASQQVDAEGNVVYTQPDPPSTLRGPRAVGRLQDKTIVVSGGRVETQIVPDL